MAEEEKKTKMRPPIVVVLGHVDHGKTTLLDYIRQTSVALKEAGGITQSVGAYEIIHNGKKLTFIDTPGHEAFSKMRQRGARAADLGILLVAADEGLKPQTKESVEILRESQTPFIVAINKIDKNNADIERVKQELSQNGVLLEGYGGDVSCQEISAKTGEGISELLDLILLAAELESLTYDPQALAEGIVIEAQLGSSRGIVATVVVKNGVLRKNDYIATATANGRIKSLENFLGKPEDFLEPSAPALILGFSVLPQIGETFLANSSLLAITKNFAAVSSPSEIPPEFHPLEKEAIRLILKADNSGSLEVLSGVVKSVVAEKPFIILEESVGQINENDFKKASAAAALIIGFRVGLAPAAENFQKTHPAKLMVADIVYELAERLKEYLHSLESPAPLAELEILAVFRAEEKSKQTLGGRIVSGSVKNRQQFEVRRDDHSGVKGVILNLQSQRRDIPEASAGEVGLLISADDIIKVGDKLVFFNQQGQK